MPPHWKHGKLTKKQQKLAVDNLPFFWFYYKLYVKPRFKHLGENTLEEIIAEMLLMYTVACEKYDPEKGKFTSYAKFYFKGAITLYFQRMEKNSRFTDVVPFIDDVDVARKKSEKVVWEEIENLFTSAEVPEESKKLLREIYRDRIPQTTLQKKYKISKTGLYKRKEKAIMWLHVYIMDKDIEMRDFIKVFDIEKNRADRSYNGYFSKEPVYP